MKSIDRITASMGVIISALRLDEANLRNLAGGNMGLFLKHKFPRVSLTRFTFTCSIKLTGIDSINVC